MRESVQSRCGASEVAGRSRLPTLGDVRGTDRVGLAFRLNAAGSAAVYSVLMFQSALCYSLGRGVGHG